MCSCLENITNEQLVNSQRDWWLVTGSTLFYWIHLSLCKRRNHQNRYSHVLLLFFSPSDTIPPNWKFPLPLSNTRSLILVINNLVYMLTLYFFSGFPESFHLSPLLATSFCSISRHFYLFTFLISLFPFPFWMQVQKAKELLLPTY